MTAVTCSHKIDCRRPANTTSGRCDLHDAMILGEEARDLIVKVLFRLDVIERLDRDVERPEEPTTCAVCGRELHPLEEIRAALEYAPGEALVAGQEQHPSDAYSFALGHLTCAVADAVRDLACRAGSCHAGSCHGGTL
jgi:hypothetical protein